MLAVIGYLVMMSGAYLGGDLVYRLGTMINRNVFIEGPKERFVRVGRPHDFAEGEMKRMEAAGMPVLIVCHRGRLHALSSTCGHAGGPLDEGELTAIITCPWHGSQFDVINGRVKRDPATFDQPTLKVREHGDVVEVKLSSSNDT